VAVCNCDIRDVHTIDHPSPPAAAIPILAARAFLVIVEYRTAFAEVLDEVKKVREIWGCSAGLRRREAETERPPRRGMRNDIFGVAGFFVYGRAGRRIGRMLYAAQPSPHRVSDGCRTTRVGITAELIECWPRCLKMRLAPLRRAQ
jgi:hypothetical protein